MALANSNTIICHLLPGLHLYTWVESSNVDKLPCWRTKVPFAWKCPLFQRTWSLFDKRQRTSAPFQKGLRLIASFLNTRFAIALRLISTIQLIANNLSETGPRFGHYSPLPSWWSLTSWASQATRLLWLQSSSLPTGSVTNRDEWRIHSLFIIIQ